MMKQKSLYYYYYLYRVSQKYRLSLKVRHLEVL
jgi:hypothetical protein